MVRRALMALCWAATAALAAAVLAPVGEAGAQTNGALVIVRDSSFTPRSVTIRPGDVVIWTMPDDTRLDHTVTSDTGRFHSDLTQKQKSAGFRFPEAGMFAYHCRIHGSPGGGGMSGVVVVDDGTTTTTTTAPGPTTTTTATTATTAPTTTTSTAPTTTTTAPTTTTTKPPKATTTTTAAPPPPPPPPPTTATTAPPPAWQPPPPPPGPPAGSATSPPPRGTPAPTPPTATTAPKSGAAQNRDRRDAATGPNAGKGPAAPPTTDTTAPPPPAPDPAVIAALEAAAAAVAAPPPEAAAPPAGDPQPIEALDRAILDTLAAATDKPPDNGSGLLVVVAVALGVFLAAVIAWAWYHRPSRYMPA